MTRFGWIALAIGLSAAPIAMAGVTIVDDGASGQPARLRLQGAIRKGDQRELQQALDRIRGAVTSNINGVPLITVELDSPGGDVVEAVDIGRTIYQNFLMTLVKPGRECVSACVFALMAGAVHTPEEGANIGLHRPLLVSWRNMSFSQARAKYDGLMDYLREYFAMLGVSDAAYDIMMRTDSYGMRYFSSAELDQLRLRGEDPAWERFYGAKWAAENAVKARPAITLADLPKLPPIDESYRTIVFMPGAYHPGIDYLAGVTLPNVRITWDSIHDGQPVIFGDTIDIAALARRVLAAVSSLLGPVWWLVGLIAFELLRARPWPGDPWDRPVYRDQWRLKDFASRA